MYTVVLVDTFSHEDCTILTTTDKDKAFKTADEYRGKQMTRCYVYDKTGKQVHATGRY